MKNKFDKKCLACGTPVKFVESTIGENHKGYRYDSAYFFAIEVLRKIRNDVNGTSDTKRQMAHLALLELWET